MELFYTGLKISIVGMGVVFSILIIISVFIYLLRFLGNTGAEDIPVISQTEHNKEAAVEDDEEIAAVISAVVASLFKDVRFRIISFTEVTEEIANSNFKDFNIWAKYGRMNIMTSHSNFGKGRLEKWKR